MTQSQKKKSKPRGKKTAQTHGDQQEKSPINITEPAEMEIRPDMPSHELYKVSLIYID
jgi:hypothetical protein